MSAHWLKARLWPGLAEMGMAFAGLVVGWIVVGTLLTLVPKGPHTLLAGPVITAVAALFYGLVGPRWARATQPLTVDGEEPPLLAGARFERAPLGRSLLVVVLGIAAALAGSILLGLLFELLELQVREQGAVLEIVGRAQDGGFGAEAAMLVVAALLLAPAAEEWLFRGLLFSRIAATSGLPLAFGLSGAAFAAIHDNPAGFVVYMWLGLVFAAVLRGTGRLWAAVAVHVGNNGYVLLVLFLGS